jgi:subtilisin family serine protease
VKGTVVSPRVIVVSCLAALAVIFLAVPISAAPAGQGPERAIVVFRDSFAGAPAQAGLLRAFGAEPLQSLWLINGVAAALPPGVAKHLLARGEVVRIDPDVEVRALAKPSQAGGNKGRPPAQPPQELPWGVNRIDAEWAWGTATGAGVNVAVIDTGIDGSHPDLAANVAGGINFVAKTWSKPAAPDKWADDNGHGTHVAGIIAALDNDIGVVGVAPRATLWAVKVLDKNGSGYLSNVIAGIQWSVSNHIDVANMSLGTNADLQSLHDACDAAAAAGVLLVAAAGNDGAAVDYPGAYSSVIAVAATDITDLRPSWSSLGPQVYLAAPGVNVKSTWKGGGYAYASGTSMAAPHATGTLALNLSANLSASADDLSPAGWDVYTGWGLVDAGEAATGAVNYGDDLP